MTVTCQKCPEGNADDTVGPECLARRGPGRPQLHDKPIAVHPYVRIGRNVDLNSSPGAVAHPIVGVNKTRLLDKPYALFWGIAIDLGPGPEIIFLRFENNRASERVGPALPKPNGAWQTGVGCHFGSERRLKQERVAIEP